MGVEVVALLDAAQSWPETLLQGWSEFDLAKGVVKALEDLRHSGIPVLNSHTIFAAHGEDEIKGASFGPVDPDDWRPQRGHETTVAVDLICIGFGFVPNTDLTHLAGCRHEYVQESGGWIPIRDATMQTTVAGVFAVGDGAGITGALASVEEGRVAGITSAERAGFISKHEADTRRAIPLARLASLQPWSKALGELTRIRPGLLDLIRPETLVCRCEEVSFAEVRAALNQGAGDLQAVKLLTRLGMGACQGRNCAPSMGMHICHTTGRTPEQIGRINPRPPVKPVTLGALAGIECMADVTPNDSFDAINMKGSS